VGYWLKRKEQAGSPTGWTSEHPPPADVGLGLSEWRAGEPRSGADALGVEVPEAAEAGVAGVADDDVVEDFELQELAGTGGCGRG